MKQYFQFCTLLLLSLTFAAPLNTVACSQNSSAQGEMNGNDTNLTAQHDGAAQGKRARTPAQQKIDSQLLSALDRVRSGGDVPAVESLVKFDEKGRALVSIRARVTKNLLAKIKSLGGEVISSSERYNDIRAHMPLEKLEELAALKNVRAIMPAEEAMTNNAK